MSKPKKMKKSKSPKKPKRSSTMKWKRGGRKK